jgi:hypothetical protein
MLGALGTVLIQAVALHTTLTTFLSPERLVREVMSVPP